MTQTIKTAYAIEQIEDKNGKPRHYKIEGIEELVPSVTGITGVIDKSRPLMTWAWNMAVEGSAQLPPMQRDIEQQRKALISDGYAHWQKSGAAALRGKNLHAALNVLIETGKVPDYDDFPEDERGFVQALARYWLAVRPGVYASEMKVGSAKHRYAGRLDLVRFSRSEQGLTVTDFKSGKADKDGKPRPPYLETHFQVAGYAYAFMEMTGLPVEHWESVSLCENGDYEVFPTVIEPVEFLTLLDFYKLIKKAEARIKELKNG